MNLDNNSPTFPPELLEHILGYDNRDQPEAALVCWNWYRVSLSLSSKAATARIIRFADFFLAQIQQPSKKVIAKVKQVKRDQAQATPLNFEEIKCQMKFHMETFTDVALMFPQGPLQTLLLGLVVSQLTKLGSIDRACETAGMAANLTDTLKLTGDVFDILREQGKVKIDEAQSNPIFALKLSGFSFKKLMWVHACRSNNL